LLKLLEGLAWIALAVFLGSGKAGEHETLRVIAAAIVTLPTAGAFTSYLRGPWEQVNDARLHALERTLEEQLLAMHSAGVYPDVVAFSFHVWLLPAWHLFLMNNGWYRKFVDRKRKRYDREKRRHRRTVDPTLRRIVRVGFEPKQTTGVHFRNGEGIVGRCIRQNLKHKALAVALDSSEFEGALQKGAEDWKDAADHIRQNLDHRSAEKLASVYGQVAAEVIQHDGHAIGCVTLDLPPNSPVRLTDKDGKPTQPIFDYLFLAARGVEWNLTQ
jgi:hypothetical protein